MRFRFEGGVTALYGLANMVVYVLFFALILLLFMRSAFSDMVVLAVQVTIGGLAIAVAWAVCFEGKEKRAVSGAPIEEVGECCKERDSPVTVFTDFY